jgi:hypothetical protein
VPVPIFSQPRRLKSAYILVLATHSIPRRGECLAGDSDAINAVANLLSLLLAAASDGSNQRQFITIAQAARLMIRNRAQVLPGNHQQTTGWKTLSLGQILRQRSQCVVNALPLAQFQFFRDGCGRMVVPSRHHDANVHRKFFRQ